MRDRSKAFLERLGSDYVHVVDGGMGTMLYSKGIFINRCFDELNLSAPDLVRSVHEEYLAAGAEIIETNTFGANRFKLRPHGLEEKLLEINIAGTRLAREVAGERALVAGSIGPLGSPLKAIARKQSKEAFEAFSEQARALAEGEADLLIIETISDLEEIGLAIKAAKEVCDLPIIASVTLGDDNNTVFGHTPEECVACIEEWGADAVGVNCSTGPGPILDSLKRMAAVSRIPLSAMPNAAVRHAQCRHPTARRGAIHLPIEPGVHGRIRQALHSASGHPHHWRLLRNIPAAHQGNPFCGARPAACRSPGNRRSAPV